MSYYKHPPVSGTTITDGTIRNADVASDAAIAATKIEDGSVSSAAFKRLNFTPVVLTFIATTGTLTVNSSTYITPAGMDPQSISGMAAGDYICTLSVESNANGSGNVDTNYRVNCNRDTAPVIGYGGIQRNAENRWGNVTWPCDKVTLPAGTNTFVPQWNKDGGSVSAQVVTGSIWKMTIERAA